MITFDSAKMIIDLKNILRETLTLLQHEVLADTEVKMLTPEGRADIEVLPIEEISGIISAFIVEGPWAIIDEFGTGTLLDQSNPFLNQYRSSTLWNPARSDLAIAGRPAGVQPTMFGEKTFSGNAVGKNLEELAQRGIVDKKYLPQPPSKALTTAMRWMAGGRFQKAILSVLETFPWGNYLIVSR